MHIVALGTQTATAGQSKLIAASANVLARKREGF